MFEAVMLATAEESVNINDIPVDVYEAVMLTAADESVLLEILRSKLHLDY